jgi:6,7-dimethyl-8-ribityllumazine synthase
LETYEGRPVGESRRIGIVCSRFNEAVTSKLLAGAVEALQSAGVAPDRIFVALVPGAVELPLAARNLARQLDLDAVVALGAVIRGDTDHYDHVCRAAQEGLLTVSLEEDLPVMFGVLTCDTEEQALARAGGEHGNKGADVALDALRMADLIVQILELKP